MTAYDIEKQIMAHEADCGRYIVMVQSDRTGEEYRWNDEVYISRKQAEAEAEAKRARKNEHISRVRIKEV